MIFLQELKLVVSENYFIPHPGLSCCSRIQETRCNVDVELGAIKVCKLILLLSQDEDICISRESLAVLAAQGAMRRMTLEIW